ncbi:MAG TPA: TolC family outer membrane protein [Caulobacteraceae bacterium]|nr:TolC family outer membrane protein [Caulobacteraceae bacterium]
MSTIRAAALVLLCVAAAGAVSQARAETLSEAIALAYETNPTLRAARANQRATDEEYPQARAGLHPTVQALGTISYDQSKTAALAPGTQSTSGAFVQFTQPVYTGGRVTNAMDAASADILAGREALRQTEIQLLQGVIKAYLDVRRDETQLDIEKESLELLKRQLDEANARFDVGEATRTDTAQARARLAQGQALLASAEAQLTTSRATYTAVIGQAPGDLAPEPPISQLLPPNVDGALDAAARDNPQIVQAAYAERASAARLAAAKSAHLPSVQIQGSVGYAGGVTPFGLPASSPFSNFARDVTVQATATVPLYAGGLIASEVRQAAERNNVDRITIDAAHRQVAQATSAAWSQLIAARANVSAYQDQVDANKIAYEGTREEEQQDLRTTLDVLNAEQELENAKLALAGAQHDEYLAAAAVLAEMGALDVGIFAPSEPRYDPTDNFKHVRNAGGWTPLDPAVEAIDHVSPAAAPAPPSGAQPPAKSAPQTH